MIIYVLGWFGLAILLMYITGMGAVLAVIISTIVLGIIKYALESASQSTTKSHEFPSTTSSIFESPKIYIHKLLRANRRLQKDFQMV